MAVSGSTVYAGGRPEPSRPRGDRRLDRQPHGLEPNPSSDVEALAVGPDGTLYVGGDFSDFAANQDIAFFPAVTATALRSSSNRSRPGRAVTYTAVVTPTPDGGTVRFTDGTSTISRCATLPAWTLRRQRHLRPDLPRRRQAHDPGDLFRRRAPRELTLDETVCQGFESA